MQTLQCFGRLLLYIIPCVLVLLPIRFWTGIPSFIFRKLLHIVAFTCFVVMMLGAADAILMWGVGGGTPSAALVGIPFGRHKVLFPPVNGTKSWEGSGAMLAASALTGAGLFLGYCGYPAGVSLRYALAMAAVGTAAELSLPARWDTVTVPVTMLAAALIL